MGIRAGKISVCAIVLACAVFLSATMANAAQVIVEHFDNHADLSAHGWQHSTTNVSHWNYSYQDSKFIATSIQPVTRQEYAYVRYFKSVTPIEGDFTLSASIGWNEEGNLPTTHSIMMYLFSGSDLVARAGYHDGYATYSGSLKSELYQDGVLDQVQYPLNASVGWYGSATVSITRTDGEIIISSDGDGITQTLTGINDAPITSIRFEMASWWSPSSDLYGDLYYDELSLTTPAMVPEPATVLLFALSLVSWVARNKR